MDNTTEEDKTQNSPEHQGLSEDGADELDAEKTEEKSEEVVTEAEDGYKDKYYYLAAEMQNMQRRFDKEKEHLLKYGSEKILTDLLDVVDNLERTLGFIRSDEDEKVKNIVVGIEMIEKLFVESLGKHGLKVIDALGKEFDPNFHEALSQQKAEDRPNMEIIQVHQSGYTLNGRVIRAAKVVVVKND